jgi:uncharacterized protein
VEARPVGRSHAQVGIVSGLWRYPVKSMAGEALASTDISWAGLAGDRRWAFVRPDSQDSGFPWHTIREFPEMSNYVALLSEPARPDRSRVLVRAPAGGLYDVTDPPLAAELGMGVRVMRLDGGAFDAMPVSVISDSTVSALCTLAHVASYELRFRPHVVVTLDSGAPFEEDDWVGSAAPPPRPPPRTPVGPRARHRRRKWRSRGPAGTMRYQRPPGPAPRHREPSPSTGMPG